MTTDIAAMMRRFFRQLGYEVGAAMMADFGISASDVKSSELPSASLTDGWNGVYLAKAKRYVPFARHLPGVRAVFVCNSVAFGTADRGSDIDLLIITDADRLWVARVFCTLFFQILGLRRHGDRIAGRFCLSFFTTEDALAFESIALRPHDPYLAYWTAALIPIFGTAVCKKLVEQNQDFVMRQTGARMRFDHMDAAVRPGDSMLRNGLEFVFGKHWNRFLKAMFFPRTKRKAAQLTDARGTIISDKMLKFHNHDRRHEFLA